MERSCVCCKGELALGSIGTELAGFSRRIFVYIQDNKLRIFDEAPNGTEGDIPINFCPMCGRKLKRSSYFRYNVREASDRATIRYA